MWRALVDWNERVFADDRHAGFSLVGLSLGLAMYFGPLAGILALLMAGVIGESPLVAEVTSEMSASPPTVRPDELDD